MSRKEKEAWMLFKEVAKSNYELIVANMVNKFKNLGWLVSLMLTSCKTNLTFLLKKKDKRYGSQTNEEQYPDIDVKIDVVSEDGHTWPFQFEISVYFSFLLPCFSACVFKTNITYWIFLFI